MEIINRLRLAIEGLEQKDFYKYLIVVVACIIVLFSVFIFWHYSKVGSLTQRIEEVNEEREDKVRSILERKNVVEQQRKMINSILSKQKDFKIAGYFSELLGKLNLTATEQRTSEVELSNDYEEVQLTARFVKLKMKQLCDLLQEIEQKQRVYAKSLEIIRSNKDPKTIEVNLVIATLQPKLRAGA